MRRWSSLALRVGNLASQSVHWKVSPTCFFLKVFLPLIWSISMCGRQHCRDKILLHPSCTQRKCNLATWYCFLSIVDGSTPGLNTISFCANLFLKTRFYLTGLAVFAFVARVGGEALISGWVFLSVLVSLLEPRKIMVVDSSYSSLIAYIY